MARAQPAFLAFALIGAIAAAYAPALHGEFLWDDDAHIGANPTVVGPLGLKEIWTSAHANYFPLVLTSFRVQHALWGLNPTGYHFVTLACHIAAALLLWRVLLALRVPAAWLGAALWALHPVQVESVAWICELKNTQSAVFFLAAIWFWLKWLAVERGFSPCFERPVGQKDGSKSHRLYYALALACAVLALLSKSSTVMLPVVLALCTWWSCGRIVRREVAMLALFFAFSVIAAGWTIWEQAYRQQAYGDEWALSFAGRCLVAGRAIWFYLLKLLWPSNLAFIYPRWTIDSGHWVGYLLALTAAAALGVLAWRARAERSAFFTGACFVVLLFPVLGFFNVYFFRFSFVGDHFQYLASMAPLALGGALLAGLSRALRFVAGTALVTALALLTTTQARDYRDPEALWRATLARNPRAWMAWDNLGELVARRGRPAEAIACYQRALDINPADADAHHNLGVEALRARNLPEALAQFGRALELNPRNARTQNGLGFALAASGHVAEAIPHYEIAVQILPEFPLARKNLASALTTLGRKEEAIPQYERVLASTPNDAAVHGDLADALGELGRWADAARHYEAALRLESETADGLARLGVALAHSGRPSEALAPLERAAQLDPGDADIQRNLGLVLRDLGRLGEAADHLSRAAELSAQPKR